MKDNYWKSRLVGGGRPIAFYKKEKFFSNKHSSWAKYEKLGWNFP